MHREYMILWGQAFGAIISIALLVCMRLYWQTSLGWAVYPLGYVLAAGALYCVLNLLLVFSNWVGFLWASWSLGRRDH